MTRTLLLSSIAAVVLFGSVPSNAIGQDMKMARGTVTALGADNVTVKVGGQEMTFAVDNTTKVEAPGAGTKSRQAQAAGKTGPVIADVLKKGQGVEVSYRDANGSLHATRLRAVPVAANAGGIVQKEPAEEHSSGTVTSLSATSLTISGSGGAGATFRQTFAIDPSTKVIGKGAGTAAAAKGGRAANTDLIANGDWVSVSFHKVGPNALHASNVRLVQRRSVATKR